MTLRVRRGLLLLITVGLGLTVFLPVWLARHDLPSRLATHWSTDTHPDGWMSLAGFTQMIAQLAGVSGVLLLAAAAGASTKATPRSQLAALGGFFGGTFGALAAAIAVWTVHVQRGLEDTRHVPGPGALGLLLIITVPVGLGSVAALLAVGRSSPSQAGATQPASIGLRDGEQASWVRTVNAPWFLGVSLLGLAHVPLLLFLDVVALSVTGVSLILAIVLLIFVGVAMTSIRVSADQRGLIVRWGPWGWPTTSVPLADIERVEAVDVRPLDSGGWGYRGSLRLLGWAAIVLRGGPGLRLDLRSGKKLTVTVDDPKTAAGLLNDLIARRPLGR